MWPTINHYERALLAGSERATKGLNNGLVFKQDLVELFKLKGGGGYVYDATLKKRHYAFKVFETDIRGRSKRYRQVYEHLQTNSSDVFVEFEYREKGIWVSVDGEAASWFPALRMEWCEGKTLDVAVGDSLRDGYNADRWARQWLRLLGALRKSHVAHGDLQHGNVIVGNNGTMRLIDYDGMFVPAMLGTDPPESGHTWYQHPGRTRGKGGRFDQHIDGVSALVILTTLAGVTPALWRARSDDDGLLITQQDLQAPADSAVLRRLERSSPPTRDLVQLLRRALQRPFGPCPEVEAAASLFGVRLPPLETTVQPVAVKAPRRKPRPPDPALTVLQVRTAASILSGLTPREVANARGVREATVRSHMQGARSSSRRRPLADRLGFRLERRTAHVMELRLAGVSEADCAKRFRVAPATIARHVSVAARALGESREAAAHQLARSLRNLPRGEPSPVPSPKPVPPTPRTPPTSPAARPVGRTRPQKAPPDAPVEWGPILATLGVVAFIIYSLYYYLIR